MLNVCVYRQPCAVLDDDCGEGSDLCKTGPIISDSLILTEEVARERGRAEIDEAYSNRKIVTGNVYLVPWIQPGGVVNISDIEQGEYQALLRAMSISIVRNSDKSITATASVTLEKHYDD